METPLNANVHFLIQFLARCCLRLLGWRTVGPAPNVPQWVGIVAPHTSNWDFVYGLLISWDLGIKGQFLAKNSLFHGPLGWFFRTAGGIPVERSHHHGLVEQAVAAFRRYPQLFLAIAPEGTRRHTDCWKSGFYHIALAAKVPIVLAYIDYKHKEGGIGPLVYPTGDTEADLSEIRSFYATITPRHPECRSDVCFKPAVRDDEKTQHTAA